MSTHAPLFLLAKNLPPCFVFVPQVFGFLAVIDVGINGFSIVNLCIMVRR